MPLQCACKWDIKEALPTPFDFLYRQEHNRRKYKQYNKFGENYYDGNNFVSSRFDKDKFVKRKYGQQAYGDGSDKGERDYGK